HARRDYRLPRSHATPYFDLSRIVFKNSASRINPSGQGPWPLAAPLSKTQSYLLFSDGYILSPKQFLYECWSAGYNAHIEASSFAERHEDTTLHVRQTGINVAMGRRANGRSSAGRARGGRRGMGGNPPRQGSA